MVWTCQDFQIHVKRGWLIGNSSIISFYIQWTIGAIGWNKFHITLLVIGKSSYYYDTIIRYYKWYNGVMMCYKGCFISHYNTLWHYYFSFYDTWDYYFSYYFFYYDRLFFIVSPIICFLHFFSIMTECLHPDNRTVQTAILDPSNSEWVISAHEEGPVTCINWKPHIQNEKQPDGASLNYHTHYFFYYTHYCFWLTSTVVAMHCRSIYNDSVCYTKLREHQVSFHCSPKRPNCSVFA